MNKFWWLKIKMEEAGADGAAAAGGAAAGEPTAIPPASGENDWRTALPEDIRGSAALASVKDVASLAKQFVDQQSYLGNSIRIPSEHAGDEDKKAFMEKLRKHAPGLIPAPNPDDDESVMTVLSALGRPQEVDGYVSPEVPEQLKEAIPAERVQFFKQVAHKFGLTNKQFQGMMGEVLAADAQNYQQAMQSLEDGRNSVKSEWGATFDQRVAQISQTLVATGAPVEFQEALKSGQVGGSTLKWLHSMVGRLGGKEGIHVAGNEGSSNTLTPDEANARISEMLNNRQHPYWIAGHPDHAAAKKEMIRLAKMADPNASSDDLRVARTA